MGSNLLPLGIIFTLLLIHADAKCVDPESELLKPTREQLMNVEMQKVIVQCHNEKRDLVASGSARGQPFAANMVQLVWNEELAGLAQSWADRCQFKHNVHRSIRRGVTGENIALWGGNYDPHEDQAPAELIREHVESWYVEVERPGYKFGGEFTGVGHYTQMVWAKSKEVGCGQSTYRNRNNGHFNVLFVCEYFPAGNVLGRAPYEPGPRNCEEYGMSNSTGYKHLCITKYFHIDEPRDDGNKCAIKDFWKSLKCACMHPWNL